MWRTVLLAICFIGYSGYALAQGAIDGYMKAKGETDFALTYSSESYDTYLFGEEEREIPTTFQSVNFFMAHGLSDSLNLVVALPYMWTDETNRSLQDAIVALKYRNTRKYFERSALSLITSVGASFPASNYSTEITQPIGAKAVTFQARFLAQYEWYTGFFVHLQTGYDLRVAPSLQNALPIIARVGYGSSKIYVDAWLDFYKTFDAGVDAQIGGAQGSSWLRAGGTIYYAVTPKFGAFVGGAHFFSGENIGLATRYNAGVVYK
ncbi:MAG: hypothetical protein AAF738_06160, partial [Bacteroidota bacterium]